MAKSENINIRIEPELKNIRQPGLPADGYWT